MKNNTEILFLCQALALFLSESISPFWPVYLASLADVNSLLYANSLTFIYIAPVVMVMISAPFWGSLGDRIGHKWMIVRSLLALSVVQLGLSFCSSIWQVIVLRTLQGAFAGSIAAIGAYALSQNIKKDKGQKIAWLHSAAALGGILGPLFAGWWLKHFDFHSLFIFFALIGFYLCILIVALLPNIKHKAQFPAPKHSEKKHPSQKVSPSANAGKCSKGGSISIYLLLFLLLLAQLGKKLPTPLLASFTEQLNIGKEHIGFIYSLTGLGTFLSAPWIGKAKEALKISDYHWLSIFALLGALYIFLQAHCHTVLHLAFVRFSWGVLLAALMPGMAKLLSDCYQYLAQGKAMGIHTSGLKLGGLLGLFLGAWLGNLYHPSIPIWIASCCYIMLAAILAIRGFNEKYDCAQIRPSSIRTSI